MALRLAAVVRPQGAGGPRLVRLVEPAGPVDLLAWLAAQPGRIKGYWADRDSGLDVAALGEADEVKGMEAGDYEGCWRALRSRWEGADPATRYYGGFRFGPWRPDDPFWRPFQAYRFVLPEFEVHRREDGAADLVCNLVFRPGGDPVPQARAALDAMSFPPEFQPRAVGAMRGRRDTPDRAGWMRMVGAALDELHAGGLAKVVLARRVCFETDRPVDALTLMHRMREESGRCYQFCGIHDAGVAFVGASPERLYRRRGRRVLSEAVAATRARGATAAADACLAAELMASPKERREHGLVADGVRAALAPLSVSVRCDPDPAVLKLARVQHLAVGVEADLREEADDPAILRRLHPTPAVGGEPAGAAMALLGRLEPFDRGWYTGPVGWVGPDAAEFAVALRCGLVAGPRLCLFSGAGIVPGSDPAAEWDEIESKLASFLAILGAS
jgi:menaquinone-specific isochorismate synthase